MLDHSQHIHFMRQAILQAVIAMEEDEIPIGAILVNPIGKIVAKGYNQTEKLHDVTAHAEMIAITSASANLQDKYLEDHFLYTTLEPCVMCAGALKNTHIKNIIFGAFDPKGGYQKFNPEILGNRNVIGGVLENECSELLTSFFKKKRFQQKLN